MVLYIKYKKHINVISSSYVFFNSTDILMIEVIRIFLFLYSAFKVDKKYLQLLLHIISRRSIPRTMVQFRSGSMSLHTGGRFKKLV